MKYLKKLVRENIYLSPRSFEEAEAYTEWLNDLETTDYVGRSGDIVTKEQENEYVINSIKNRGDVHLSIITLENDTLIGGVSISKINYKNRS